MSLVLDGQLSPCELRVMLQREMEAARQTLDNATREPSHLLRAQYKQLEDLLASVENYMLTAAMEDMTLQPSAL